MSDTPKNFWSWVLSDNADRNLLVTIAVLCVVLAVAGLVFPSSAIPYLADIPMGTAIAAFTAALTAIVLSWPLRFLLRRRASYYAEPTDKQADTQDNKKDSEA